MTKKLPPLRGFAMVRVILSASCAGGYMLLRLRRSDLHCDEAAGELHVTKQLAIVTKQL